MRKSSAVENFIRNTNVRKNKVRSPGGASSGSTLSLTPTSGATLGTAPGPVGHSSRLPFIQGGQENRNVRSSLVRLEIHLYIFYGINKY